MAIPASLEFRLWTIVHFIRPLFNERWLGGYSDSTEVSEHRVSPHFSKDASAKLRIRSVTVLRIVVRREFDSCGCCI